MLFLCQLIFAGLAITYTLSDILDSCWLMATFSCMVLFVVSAIWRSETLRNSAATEFTLATISFLILTSNRYKKAVNTCLYFKLWKTTHSALVIVDLAI